MVTGKILGALAGIAVLFTVGVLLHAKRVQDDVETRRQQLSEFILAIEPGADLSDVTKALDGQLDVDTEVIRLDSENVVQVYSGPRYTILLGLNRDVQAMATLSFDKEDKFVRGEAKVFYLGP